MTNEEVKAAVKCLGAYRLYWTQSSYSVAAVGCLFDGTFWYAPCNWTSASAVGVVSTNWNNVIRVELIEQPWRDKSGIIEGEVEPRQE